MSRCAGCLRMDEAQLQEELGRLREKLQQKVSEISVESSDLNTPAQALIITESEQLRKKVRDVEAKLVNLGQGEDEGQATGGTESGNLNSENELAQESSRELTLDDEVRQSWAELTRPELQLMLGEKTDKCRVLRRKVKSKTKVINPQEEEDY